MRGMMTKPWRAGCPDLMCLTRFSSRSLSERQPRKDSIQAGKIDVFAAVLLHSMEVSPMIFLRWNELCRLMRILNEWSIDRITFLLAVCTWQEWASSVILSGAVSLFCLNNLSLSSASEACLHCFPPGFPNNDLIDWKLLRALRGLHWGIVSFCSFYFTPYLFISRWIDWWLNERGEWDLDIASQPEKQRKQSNQH